MTPPVVLITGTRKGIGRALALHYLDRGYRVIGCSRRTADIAHQDYLHVDLDVTDEAAVGKLMQRVRSFGVLQAVLNNAGIASRNHVLLTPLDTVERLLRTNVLGTFLLCREAARLLRGTAHARIVNVSSVAVPLRLEGEAIYAASKSAVETLTRVLARELAPWGITCNAVGPGPIATDLLRGVPADALDRLLARQAVGRLAEPADVANVIDFFLRPESDQVTGQVIYLGGVG